MFNYSNAFPQLASTPHRALPARPAPRDRRSPTLSRRELRRLIADMID